ncbi:hypothetical protein M514_00793 [Trichuris suis]|uniref:Uncharacterized protein n=1 Tax=Trichuris suis TaxID=68888 RepID=A0A085N9A9_9BILA|nr:hypothetical protein M513_00793 [Trichuris suis]KFD66055.1 hypothetical protein M514_00793 [Trichuris suis]
MQNGYHRRAALGSLKETKWDSAYVANYVLANIVSTTMVKICVQRLHFNFLTFICFSSAFLLFGICLIYRKLFSKSILWVPLRNLPGLMLPVLTIYAMLSMQIIMMQDDIRFAQTVRLTTCFNPAVLLLHRRITSTYKPRNYETVTALTIAFAAILANVHIFSSLEPLHCVAGVIWLIFHYILFAWFEHFKQAKHLNAAHELLTIFTALCAFSLFLFIIDSRLLEVFQYFEMNKHHSFPYIVFPALVFSIAWYVGSLIHCLTVVPVFTLSLATASVPGIQLWFSFVVPMQYVLLDAWPRKVTVLAQFILLLSIVFYFERCSLDKWEKCRKRSIMNN